MVNLLLKRRSSSPGICMDVFPFTLITFLILISFKPYLISSGAPAQMPLDWNQSNTDFSISYARSLRVGPKAPLLRQNNSCGIIYVSVQDVMETMVEEGEMTSFSKLLKSIKVLNEILRNQIYLVNNYYTKMINRAKPAINNYSHVTIPKHYSILHKPIKTNNSRIFSYS